MIGMTGQRAVRILEWVEKSLKEKDTLTPFEKSLLERLTEAEITIPGYGRLPAIEVGNIIPKMKLVLDDATVWEVESIHKVDNNLLEIVLNSVVTGITRQIIRKRPMTRIGYIKDS